MKKYTHSHQSRQDLFLIWDYIAQDHLDAADRLLDTLDEKLRLLADNPRLGTLRPDIAPELRTFPVGSYLIFYREERAGIEIVRVLHGARNLSALFSADE